MTGFAEYDDYDGLGLAQLVRLGDVTAAELLEEAIVRTEKINGDLNALVQYHYDLARASIDAGLPDGPFHGVPFLLKDLYMMLQGTVTSNGSGMFRDYIPDYDSTLVQRFKQASLVIFGKTNSPELGLLPVTEPVLHGPTRNPWDVTRTPGGSSGGAAAAVAAGVLPIAHASDGGGSIRIPASCTGLVGLKPSRARIPFGPQKTEGWAGQSTSGVVSRTVRDTAAMLDVMHGPETGDAYAAPTPTESFMAAMQHAPGPLRIAVGREKWGHGVYQPEVLAGLAKTVALLEALGHHCEDVTPHYDAEATAAALFTIICVNTALACRQRAAELGCSVDALDIEEGTRFTLELGNAVPGADYAEAIQLNQRAGRVMGRLHEHYDLILNPTLSSAPIPIGWLDGSSENYADQIFGFMGVTGLFNQTGQPSISLPLHWSDEGLPVGMMLTAAFGNDALLLQLAAQLEQAAPWWERRPPLHAGA